MDYLNRGQSHLPDAIWREIDKAATEAAGDRLTGRRFLELQGPFGAGLTSIEAGNDDYCRQPSADEAGAVMGRAISVPMLRRAFRLSVRRVTGYLENGQPLDLTPAQDAAEAVANREEEFIYRGQPDFRLPGLLTHEDRQQLDGGDWAAVERALSDVLAAVTQLDEPGIAGHMPWRWLRRSTMGCSGSIPAPTSRRSSICGISAPAASTRRRRGRRIGRPACRCPGAGAGFAGGLHRPGRGASPALSDREHCIADRRAAGDLHDFGDVEQPAYRRDFDANPQLNREGDMRSKLLNADPPITYAVVLDTGDEVTGELGKFVREVAPAPCSRRRGNGLRGRRLGPFDCTPLHCAAA